jgi:hypothetical protein
MKAIAAAMVLSTMPLLAAALEPTEVFDKVSPSVWIVRTFDGNERPVGQGSAVVIGPGRLATNCHVLAKSKQVTVRRRNVAYEAKLEHADVARDLCILEIEGFDAPALRVRRAAELKVGEKVFAVGNPRGLEVTLSEGLISGLRGELPGAAIEQGGGNVIQTTAPISPGSSGGGLFDAEGRLVGITTMHRRDSQNINIALPAEWIAEVPARSAAALAKRKAPQVAARARGVPEGYPLPGTVWVYRFTERGLKRGSVDVTVRANRVDRELIEESISGGSLGAFRRNVHAREPRILRYRLGGEASVIELAPYLVAANDNTLPVGPIRPIGYPGTGASGRAVSYKWRTRPHDWEDVVVPAGTYRALRYEIDADREDVGSVYLPRGDATTRLKLNVWYSPEVQRIVKLEHKVWTNAAAPYSDDAIELLEYRPPR